MSAPLHNRFESALADLRAQQEKIRDFGAAMAARTTSVTSKNRMVSATVDSSGPPAIHGRYPTAMHGIATPTATNISAG